MKSSPILSLYVLLAKLLLAGIFGVVAVQAASGELSRCGHALQHAVKGNFDDPVSSASCPVTATLVEWLYLQKSGQKQGASFARIIAFLRKNPSWPLKDKLQSKAEAALTGTENVQDIISWFETNTPLTPRGAEFYARALITVGNGERATKTIREAWQHLEFTDAELNTFHNEFESYLTRADHNKRASRLLMRENIAAVQPLLPWLGSAGRLVAEARIALIGDAGNAQEKLDKVPLALRNDAGLIYDRLKNDRRNEQNMQMLKLFLKAPPPEPKQDEDLWWRERNLLVRRLMDEHRYRDAWNLVSRHGLSEGENFANAEWLAGWLTLRKLNKPEVALKHFITLRNGVKSPVSVSRAAYWCSRAAQVLGQKEQAQRWLTEAKTFPGTFYGQVALRGGITGKTPLLHSRRPRVDAALHHSFENRPFIQVIRLLTAVKAKHLCEPFIVKLAQEITNPGEQIFMIELVSRNCGSYYGILTAKKLPLKNLPLIEAAYPLLSRHFDHETRRTNSPLVHAIIRQESRFKADAISPAGAQGLMQLMPKTALHTAQKIKYNHKSVPPAKHAKKGRLGGKALGNALGGSLSNPDVNIALGCAHVRDLLDKYNGSLILTIAAYNAGGKAVDKWLEQYGDPRSPGVDLVDWIETIPYAETRNYVQRVLENYAWYKQQLG
jgi:soluble lytic murein transglycosylase